jgi:hypothetical protein
VDSYIRTLPFEHLLIASFLPHSVEAAFLAQLEKAEWEKRGAEFYRFQVPVAGSVRAAMHEAMCAVYLDAKSVFENTLRRRLAPPLLPEVHRYSAGDGIGPHTDAVTPEVRCILNLNSGWSAADGGVWTFSSDSALKAGRAFLPSLSNFAVAFATGPTTYHALSSRRAGTGYAVTLRFPVQ